MFRAVRRGQIGVEQARECELDGSGPDALVLSFQVRLKYTSQVHQGIWLFKKPAFLDVFVKCQRVPPSPPLVTLYSFDTDQPNVAATKRG